MGYHSRSVCFHIGFHMVFRLVGGVIGVNLRDQLNTTYLGGRIECSTLGKLELGGLRQTLGLVNTDRRWEFFLNLNQIYKGE